MMINVTSILIIEDVGGQALLWKEYLQEGLPKVLVDIANRPSESIRLFDKKNYDLIILDIMMLPEESWDHNEVFGGFLSGIKVYKEIIRICEKKSKKTPKVIVTTAIKDARPELYDTAYEFLSQQADAWFDKPFNPKLLKDKIVELISS